MSRKMKADSLRARIPFSQKATKENLRQVIDSWDQGSTVEDIKKMFPDILEVDPDYNRDAEEFDSMTLSERVEFCEVMRPKWMLQKNLRDEDLILHLLMELWVEGMPYAQALFEAVKKYFG